MIAGMHVTLRINPLNIDRFTPDTFARVVGEDIAVIGFGQDSVQGRLYRAEVEDDGKAALLTVDVPDDATRRLGLLQQPGLYSIGYDPQVGIVGSPHAMVLDDAPCTVAVLVSLPDGRSLHLARHIEQTRPDGVADAVAATLDELRGETLIEIRRAQSGEQVARGRQ